MNSVRCILGVLFSDWTKSIPALVLLFSMWSGSLLSGACQPQCPGPLAWHLAEGQLGQEDLQAARLHGRPLQRAVTQKLHLFKRKNTPDEQRLHVDTKDETAPGWPHFPGCNSLIGHPSRVWSVKTSQTSLFWGRLKIFPVLKICNTSHILHVLLHSVYKTCSCFQEQNSLLLIYIYRAHVTVL